MMYSVPDNDIGGMSAPLAPVSLQLTERVLVC